MSLQDFTDYKLPKDAYLTFDAQSLKQLLIDRLNENETFTDQNFEGSNFNAFIDVVSYMYHVLLFYLNTTSNETTFNTATIYENMNKIVSNLGYKPLGDQTSILTIDMVAELIASGVYTLPRFSFINIGSVSYYTLEDITFEKTGGGARQTLEINNSALSQGNLKEALFTASGEEYEMFTLIDSYTSAQFTESLKSQVNQQFIADNAFVIYVKDAESGLWSAWSETTSLFTAEPLNHCYEKRFNHNGNYEFKFGNGNNGRSLREGDQVVVFYIISDGDTGIVGKDASNDKSFNLYASDVFNEIKAQLYTDTEEVIVVPELLPRITTYNKYTSTPIRKAETVDEIRANAPKIFSAQDRLVSKSDYESLINRRFSNIAKPVKVLSNDDYTSQVLFYFNKVGVSKGIDDARTLLSQVNFSTSTNFNNVYVYTVRTAEAVIDERIPNYLTEGQKKLIADFCADKKDISHNVVISDPIFKAFSFGVGEITNTNTIDDIIRDSFIRVNVDRNVAISDASIKQGISNAFRSAFSDINLGDLISTAEITRNILNIDGVEGLETVNGNNVTPNLSFMIWNPDYRYIDNTVLARDYKLKSFEYGYFYKISDIASKISIRRV